MIPRFSRLKCALLAALCLASLSSPASVCTPTAATLCVGADDIADVWINGQCVASCSGDFPYVPGNSGTGVTCISVNPAILSPTGANSIAVRVRDTAPSEMWGTWSLDISCAGGGHAYANSDDPALEVFYDSTGSSPPPVLGGNSWYETSYVPAPAWSAPVAVSGAVYGKPATDAFSGLTLTPRSWAATNTGNGVGALYFRQGFQLTPQPTATPSYTPSATETETPSSTPTDTRTATPTFSDSPTTTASPTISPTFTASQTFTFSPTITVTATPFIHNGLIDLKGIFPNPFSLQLQIVYVLGEDADVQITIYNVAGEIILQKIESLTRGIKAKVWKGDNDAGGRCASGVYPIHVVARPREDSEGFWVNAVIAR